MKYKIYKKIAILMTIVMLAETVIPSVVLASSSSPNQPEFSHFESVNSNSMVNEFTGDFTYNLPVLQIPGPEGGGYALSLSYQGGNSPDADVSWVGYGWTLNPGAIIRNKQGLPDDYKGKSVEYWNKVPASNTLTMGLSLAGEVFGIDKLNGNANAALRYNSQKGFGYVAGLGLGYDGMINAGYSVTEEESNFSASINPFSTLYKLSTLGASPETLKATAPLRAFVSYSNYNLFGSQYSIISRSHPQRSVTSKAYDSDESGTTYLSADVAVDPSLIPAGLKAGIFGSSTTIRYKEMEGLKTYGYLYSNLATATDVMDFYYEKDQPYAHNNKNLPIPFSNTDIFIASGEGIGGTFRLHQDRIGHFSVNERESFMSANVTNLQVHVGGDLGAGLTQSLPGLGRTITTKKWNDNDFKFSPEIEGNLSERVFFRFSNDPAGKIVFDDNDTPVKSDISADQVFSPLDHSLKLNPSEKNRSSFITYHTNKEMVEDPVKAYTKESVVNENSVDRNTESIRDGIGEIVIFNENGIRYEYGLPVYSKNEYDLQLHVDNSDEIINNHLVLKDIESSFPDDAYNTIGMIDKTLPHLTGEFRPEPYANSFLLTTITTSGYIDRTHDGPTDDDFGGWTKFNYASMYMDNPAKEYGEGNAWYSWRKPYQGLLYQKNKLSDPNDDIGVISGGLKEVYYLESIETKTHIAKFITSIRSDGREAAPNHLAAKSLDTYGNESLKKLDKIQLYSKNEAGAPGVLLNTVVFDYDYSVFTGTPDNPSGEGKLTLKRVWFKNRNIENTRISPYEFEYEYKDSNYYINTLNLTDDQVTKYQDIIHFADNFSQNPSYSAFMTDSWGYYRMNGEQKHLNMNPWVDQSIQFEDQFDPAAWQLKAIKLPSGGEIHVQYEQDEYSYVQDRKALAMVSLDDSSWESENDNSYVLNAEDLGIQEGDLENLEALKAAIEKLYVGTGEKMYFKLLYELVEEENKSPDIHGNCNAEYITGYADVVGVNINQQGKLAVKLGLGINGNFRPKQLCMDMIDKTMGGKLDEDASCDPTGGLSQSGSTEDRLMYFSNFLGNTFGLLETCAEINFTDSYLRVPMIKPKKGGGLRVKRLLTCDKGLEEGAAVLYGQEFIYKNPDGTGSGVAANEPAAAREENALISFMETKDPKFANKLIGGEDLVKYTGYLGETILPSPSVGYQSVIIRSIHTGKTSTGFEHKTFHTAKDHPFIVEKTGIQTKDDMVTLPLFPVAYHSNELWATQGYSFILNHMHGQPQSSASYGDILENYAHTIDSIPPVTKSIYHYYEPEKTMVTSDGPGSYSYEQLGKEMEIVMAGRSEKDENDQLTLSIDNTVGFLGIAPIPWWIPVPFYSHTKTSLQTHVTTKVVRYPAILDRVEHIEDGMHSLVENSIFNPETGKPIITKTYDGYHGYKLGNQNTAHSGIYLNYAIPASQQYEALQSKAYNEGRLFKGIFGYNVKAIDGQTIAFSGEKLCDAMTSFFPGDLLKITKTNSQSLIGYFHVDKVEGNTLKLLSTSHNDGNDEIPVDQQLLTVEIIRSGKTNELNANVGEIVTYGNSGLVSETNSDSDITDLLNILNSFQEPFGKVKVLTPLGNCEYADFYISYEEDFVEITLIGNDNDTLCNKVFYKSGGPGWFGYDYDADQLLYFTEDNACSPTPLCISFCYKQTTNIESVISSGAQSLDDHWPYDEALYEPAPEGANDYEKGIKGKWRPKSSYAYKTDIMPGSAEENDAKIYKNAGVYQEFELFNWQSEAQNDPKKWLKVNTNTMYSPHGQAIEAKDILDIPVTVKYGYEHTVPYLQAQNATSRSILFESFEHYSEDETHTYFEDGWKVLLIRATIDAENVHAGKKALKVNFAPQNAEQDFSQFYFPSLTFTESIKDHGILVKMWVKTSQLVNLEDIMSTSISIQMSNVIKQPEIVTQVGEWVLVEAEFHDFYEGLEVGEDLNGKLTFTRPHGSIRKVWIDDLRIQPIESSMNNYVYDTETLRLMTTFGDQHFGVYYQYNAEGKLIRKIVETERGRKTIQENHYHVPMVAK